MSLSYDAAQLGFPYKAESLATTSSLQTFPTQSIHKVSAGNGRIGNEIRTADLVSQIGKTKSIINNFAGSKRKEPSFRRDPSDEVLDRSFMMKHPEQRPTMRQATTLNVFQPSVSYQAAPLRSTSTRQQQSPDRRYPRGIPPPPPDLPPPTLPYAANNLELHGTEDYFPPHHYQTPPTVPPKIIEFGDVYAVELYTPMMQVPSAPLISEVNRPRDAPLENTQRTPNLERNEGPRNRWAKKDISTGTRILSVSFMKSTISKDRTLGESACQATLLAEFAQNSQKRRRRAFLRSPKSSPTLLKDPRSPKSPPTLLNDPRSRTSSPTLLHDPWALPPPPPPPNESTISSPREYLASPDGIVPRYSQEVELPTGTTNSSRVTRKLGPKQSRVISDLATASRRPRVTGSSKASDENLKLIGRSSIDLGNAPREHSLYYNVTPKADGLYHCPFEDDPKANCTHKPSKDRYNYDKFIDSHLKPYRCKVDTCKDLYLSSTAELLRHEREAHAMHGHGDKPFLCTYEGCERGVPGNGFPRHWNLRDHLKRIHNDLGLPALSSPSGSPPLALPSDYVPMSSVSRSYNPTEVVVRLPSPPLSWSAQHPPLAQPGWNAGMGRIEGTRARTLSKKVESRSGW